MTDTFDLNAGSITASLVVSPEGSAASSSGTSKGLGNTTDQALLRWFRSRSQIVLTSGKTAELENYRLPSRAELAILSKSNRTYRSLGTDVSKVIFLENLSSYAHAIEALADLGYSKIHCEFGPTGFIELVKLNIVEGYVSCMAAAGIEEFAFQHQVGWTELQTVGDDLYVARVLGRG